MKHRLAYVVVFALLTVATPSLVRSQGDPRAGNWKLNVAKSKYTPGPPPASETRTYEIQDHAMKVSIESIDAKGNHVSLHYTAGDDGKDYPLAGLSIADAIAVKRVDAHTFDMDTKKSGKIIGTSHVKISSDGKVLTLTTTTAGAHGELIQNVAVFDKQ